MPPREQTPILDELDCACRQFARLSTSQLLSIISYKTETMPDMENEDKTLNYPDIIETVISSLDQHNNVLVSASAEGHIWKFKYGSVDVFIQLTGSSEEDSFTIWSPVLQLPVQNEAQLMRKLMELNWLSTFEAHFSLFNQQVVTVTSRSVADLSPVEISHLITLVATIADDYDDDLQAEFPAAI